MDERICEQIGEDIRERFTLSYERIMEFQEEETVAQPFLFYFRRLAEYLKDALIYAEMTKHVTAYTQKELEEWNQRIYGELLPEGYVASYANPEYAEKTLGAEYGVILSFVYTEVRGCLGYARENRWLECTIFMELLIEIYNLFEEQEELQPQQVRKVLYYFYYDYCDVLVPARVAEQYNPQAGSCVAIAEQADLQDLRYLYSYGEYISEYDLRTARYLNELPQEEIEALAFTYTDGYREGFQIAGIDLSKKQYVNLHYVIGQERMIRAAIKQFRELGLEPVIFRPAVSLSLIHI